MAVTFGYEFAVVKPELGEIVKGSIIPWCADCDSKVLLQAVGIVGAIIMPHNLYLHSALVKSRKIDRKDVSKVKEANFYFFVEASIALFISFIINVFVVSVFAHGLNGKQNKDVIEQCENVTSLIDEAKAIFVGDTLDVDIYKGGIFLGCTFGVVAMYIWAIGILAAGQSSTMTGTYSGQFAMEGFLNLKWARYQRVLLTRTIAIVPTFCVAFFSQIEQVTKMNDYLNAVMVRCFEHFENFTISLQSWLWFQALQLPFATIPTIAFSSSVNIMGDFANGFVNRVIAILLSIVVIGINIFFVINQVQGANLSVAWIVLIGKFYLMTLLETNFHKIFYPISDIWGLLHSIQHLLGHSHVLLDRMYASFAILLRAEICTEKFVFIVGRFQ